MDSKTESEDEKSSKLNLRVSVWMLNDQELWRKELWLYAPRPANTVVLKKALFTPTFLQDVRA